MSKICTNCDSDNLYEAKFCRKCGKQDFKKRKESNTIKSSNNKRLGSKFLKTIVAILVVIIILMIASAIFQLFIHGFVETGEAIYQNYGTVGSFFFVIFKISPLLIGIWLIKVSWKKITN